MESIAEDGLRVHEVAELSALYSDFETSVHEIAYPKGFFGTYYATPDTSTIAWEGELNFSWLEEEALVQLPHLILGVAPDLRDCLEVVATLFLEDKAIELYLDIPPDLKMYRSLMRQPEHLWSARYDVGHKHTNGKRWYVFTAENTSFEDDAELTVQLPGDLVWTGELVRWILRHHSRAQDLEGSLEVDVLAAALTRTGQGPSA